MNVSIEGRLNSGTLFGGGVDTGRTVLDNCFVTDSPQQLLYCRVTVPFHAQTQVKLYGSYLLPYDINVSAMFQNVGGPEIEANYSASNAEIAPSLGRNLAACRGAAVCNARVTVPLVEPLTLWEDRRTQLDLRLSKRFRMSSHVSLKANFDVYNVMNASPVLGVNHTYGARWREPFATTATEAILQGRFFQFSGQLTF